VRPEKAQATHTRRLLDDREAAAYIGASRSYVRALIARGALRRVELPATDGNGGRARMLRIDVQELDGWIERLKAQAT
jgi:excisionase family DNA binding protein